MTIAVYSVLFEKSTDDGRLLLADDDDDDDDAVFRSLQPLRTEPVCVSSSKNDLLLPSAPSWGFFCCLLADDDHRLNLFNNELGPLSRLIGFTHCAAGLYKVLDRRRLTD